MTLKLNEKTLVELGAKKDKTEFWNKFQEYYPTLKEFTFLGYCPKTNLVKICKQPN